MEVAGGVQEVAGEVQEVALEEVSKNLENQETSHLGFKM